MEGLEGLEGWFSWLQTKVTHTHRHRHNILRRPSIQTHAGLIKEKELENEDQYDSFTYEASEDATYDSFQYEASAPANAQWSQLERESIGLYQTL